MSESRWNNIFCTLLHIELQHEQGAANGQKHRCKDDEEVADIYDGLSNKSDEERCLLEEFEPIKDFDPQEEDVEGSE